MGWRTPRSLAMALLVAGVTWPLACGTSAVGVDDCRAVEIARCEAAVACPAEFPELDAAECRVFYQDHCLHGLAVSEPPGASDLANCETAIRAAGECASRGVTDLTECDGVTSATSLVSTPCEAVQSPSLLVECGWLLPYGLATGGAGGQGGAGSGGSASGGGDLGPTE